MDGDRRRRSSGALSLDPAALLREYPVDPSLEEGARNAVVGCLGVEPGHEVVLVIERDYDLTAAALLKAAEAAGARVRAHIVDARKAASTSFLEPLLEQLRAADASLFIGSVDGLPSSFRHRVVNAGGERRRHGHMPGLTPSMLQQAMRTDYAEVRALSRRLLERLSGEVVLEVRTPRGTDLTVRCGPGARWHAEDGLLRGPGWTNLPAGEVLTSPASVDGVLVPDGGVWDTEGKPVKNADRLRFTFQGGRVVAIEGGPGTEPDRILAQLDAHEHARRAGQVGLGTNIGVVAAVGNLLQDVKMPGFHLSLGFTAPEHTGASWTSAVEAPLLVRRADVDAGETPILRAGRYVAPWI